MQHLKELNDPIMEGVLAETQNMMAQGRMDLPLSLCFAAVRGDDLLLHQLLKRGLDPNEADNSGRTALVSNFLSNYILSILVRSLLDVIANSDIFSPLFINV